MTTLTATALSDRLHTINRARYSNHAAARATIADIKADWPTMHPLQKACIAAGLDYHARVNAFAITGGWVGPGHFRRPSATVKSIELATDETGETIQEIWDNARAWISGHLGYGDARELYENEYLREDAIHALPEQM